MHKQGKSSKLQSDAISRIKAVQKSLDNCDLDEEYKIDKCSKILACFKNKGANEKMQQYSNTKLPVGKYSLSVYKYAVNLYIKYLEESSENKV